MEFCACLFSRFERISLRLGHCAAACSRGVLFRTRPFCMTMVVAMALAASSNAQPLIHGYEAQKASHDRYAQSMEFWESALLIQGIVD